MSEKKLEFHTCGKTKKKSNEKGQDSKSSTLEPNL